MKIQMNFIYFLKGLIVLQIYTRRKICISLSYVICITDNFDMVIIYRYTMKVSPQKEYTIRKVQENHKRMELNGKHQLLLYATGRKQTPQRKTLFLGR
jgi:hypothetical protein